MEHCARRGIARSNVVGDALRALSNGPCAQKVDIVERLTFHREVQVRVVKARNDGATFKVNHFSLGSYKVREHVGSAHGLDEPIFNDKGFDKLVTVKIDVTVGEEGARHKKILDTKKRIRVEK